VLGLIVASGISESFASGGMVPNTTRAVEFDYCFVVRNLPAGASSVVAYVPVPPSDTRQDLIGYQVRSDYPHEELSETEYGNRFLRFDLSSALKGSSDHIAVTIRYRVRRTAYRVPMQEQPGPRGRENAVERFLAA